MINSRVIIIESIVTRFVNVHPHETSALFYSSSTFFFILSAYFVVLPLRDEGAISVGLDKLPELFVGSLLLTLVAAPVSTLIFSSPNISKSKALLLIHRFFGVSLVLFFVLWHFSSPGYSFTTSKNLSKSLSTAKEELKVEVDKLIPTNSVDWVNHGWFYVSVRVGLFLWIALLNLITISSTWARIIDVMDTESGSRLFGFIGAGATLGQLCGSLFATGMAWMGPYLLLLAALLMELAAQSSMMIHKDSPCIIEELHPIREADSGQRSEADSNQRSEADGQSSPSPRLSPKMSKPAVAPQIAAILDGFQLILSSSYLLYVSLFLWLGAVVSSFFYFQKVTVIASTVASPAGRRKLFAQINSFIAVFILAGQLTLTGRILTIAGVTVAICSTPFVALLNLVAVAMWPMWLAVAVSETLRKVVTYVVTRPGRELLFTVVSQEEKYKAKVCIDVVVQRLGDATAAGLYKLLSSNFNGKISTVSLCAVPVCLLWIITAFHLGRRQTELAKYQSVST